VKVLQMKEAKDPDEFLKKFGADRFKLLLEESSNRVEYQLRAIIRKYDLNLDEERVKFITEAADFICTLDNAVQREIYGIRAADAAQISHEAIKIEVAKAHKRRIAREKKKQERIDLAPARNLQPKSRSIRYDNMKSALAEEAVIATCLREPALLDRTRSISAEMFSSPLLGKVFSQLRVRHDQGLEVNLGGLEDLSQEEMSHMAYICQKQDGPVSEKALEDCVATIRDQHQSGSVQSEDDLMRFRNQLKERKGIKE